MYRLVVTLFILSITGIVPAFAYTPTLPADTGIVVPLGGNAWVGGSTNATIRKSGLENWSDASDTISIYVRLESVGEITAGLKLRVPSGSSRIALSCAGKTFTKTVANRTFQHIVFGNLNVREPGYIRFEISGVQKSGNIYAEISDLTLQGSALAKGAVYVKDNHQNYFYWGRRGPSVHLQYKIPDKEKNKVEWFYNEVTVPPGNDVQGSYFMANGFSGGYFGMQVNSPTERRVLFSVWSPFATDDPKSIPDSLKIKLLKKGERVHAGEFGNEGSGGQSYMRYPWKAGETYAFLLHAEADSLAGNTIFTAYFKAAGDSEWLLIARFKRPQSGFYLKGLYSFLENFNPDTGNKPRKAFYGNQWFRTTAGIWHQVTASTFTGDATAKINFRKDYSGGVENHLFYLRNCGFFDDFTTLNTVLSRHPANQSPPDIDFEKLP